MTKDDLINRLARVPIRATIDAMTLADVGFMFELLTTMRADARKILGLYDCDHCKRTLPPSDVHGARLCRFCAEQDADERARSEEHHRQRNEYPGPG